MTPFATEQQLDALEARYGVELPELYRRFAMAPELLAERVLVGTDVTYSYVNGMKERASEIANEFGQGFEFEPRDFIFASAQGVSFLYFRCAGKYTDPEIYRYDEGESNSKVVCGSFSEWVELCCQEGRDA